MRIPKIPGVQGDVQDLPLMARLVTALQGLPVSNKKPTKGQGLVWNGMEWSPADVNPQTFKGARIQATSTQSVADSTNTDLVYQSVLFDTDSMTNLGTNNKILTVNTEGIYLVVCCTQWSPNGTGRRINVAIHNGLYSSGSVPDVDSQADNRNAVWTPVGGTSHSSNTSVGIYQAVVGDYFSSGAYQGSGAALNANGFANCFLSAVLIGS